MLKLSLYAIFLLFINLFVLAYYTQLPYWTLELLITVVSDTYPSSLQLVDSFKVVIVFYTYEKNSRPTQCDSHSQVKEKSYHSSFYFWATYGSDVTLSTVLTNKKQCFDPFRRIRASVYIWRHTIIPSLSADWSISVLFFGHRIDLFILHSTVLFVNFMCIITRVEGNGGGTLGGLFLWITISLILSNMSIYMTIWYLERHAV